MKARQQSANATLDAAEKEGYLRTQEEK